MTDSIDLTELRKRKWYNHDKFPLLPRLEIRKANKHNTWGFTFHWLFFTAWSLDSFSLEVALICSTHWGIGVIGIFPYLRWAVTIPIPYSMGNWVDNKLDRKPKGWYIEDL
jgi:hypothetical protein